MKSKSNYERIFLPRKQYAHDKTPWDDLPKGTYYYLFVDDSDKTIYSGSVTLVR